MNDFVPNNKQNEALDAATNALWGAFTFRDGVDQASLRSVLAQVVTPLPKYSNRLLPQVTDVTSHTMGANIIPYYVDRSCEPNKVYVVTTLESRPDGRALRGLFGGHVDHDKHINENGIEDVSRGESLIEGVLREMSEELLDDEGAPILNIRPKRLSKLGETTYYYNMGGEQHIHNNRFALELTEDEFTAIKEHADKMSKDTSYKGAVVRASGGEICGIDISLIDDAIDTDLSTCKYNTFVNNLSELKEMLGLGIVNPKNTRISAVTNIHMR